MQELPEILLEPEGIQEVPNGGSAEDAGSAVLDAGEPTTEDMLRAINSLRRRLNADQVNWVREAVLLDGMSSTAVARRLYPAVKVSSIWALVRGKTYRDVPLSRRLKLAYRSSVKKRQVPVQDAPPEVSEEPESQAQEKSSVS